jgi:DNA-binding CsgD family transcriptional regulator
MLAQMLLLMVVRAAANVAARQNILGKGSAMLRDLLTSATPMAGVSSLVPSIVKPLHDAVAHHGDLTCALQDSVAALGFDSFVYSVGATLHPHLESRVYTWTSAPRKWLALYDESGFIEIDPRIDRMRTTRGPQVWDRNAFTNTLTNRRFLDAASSHGICSGIVLGINRPEHTYAMFALNSSALVLDDTLRQKFAAVMGQALVLAAHVHDLFLAQVLEKCLPPPPPGRPLSRREGEVLQLASKGMSTSQIAELLQISERTVYYYVGNILTKLDAANRHEAIAKAVARGLVAA